MVKAVLLLVLALGCNRSPLSVPSATPDQARVVCGQTECDLDAAMFCCDDHVHGPLCVTACPAGDWLECDGPEDCQGGVCCGLAMGEESTASCAATGTHCSLGIFCHSDADCAASGPCDPLNPKLYPGVGTCRGS